MNYVYILDFLLLPVAYAGVTITAQTGIYCVVAMESLSTAIRTIFFYIFYCIKYKKKKYIYWFKQQAIVLAGFTIWWGICYVAGSKWMGKEAKVIVLTPDYAVVLVSNALLFIFLYPFMFKLWYLMDEDNEVHYNK